MTRPNRQGDRDGNMGKVKRMSCERLRSFLREPFDRFLAAGALWQLMLLSTVMLLLILLFGGVRGLCIQRDACHTCAPAAPAAAVAQADGATKESSPASRAMQPLWWAFVRMSGAECMDNDENHGWEYMLSAAAVLLGGLLWGGFITALIVNVFEKNSRFVREGGRRYRFEKDHAVVLGWDVMGVEIVHQLLHDGGSGRKVVIVSCRDPREIRAEMRARLNDYDRHERRIFLFNGEFDAPDELKWVNPAAAAAVVILGEPELRGSDNRSVEAAMAVFQSIAANAGKRQGTGAAAGGGGRTVPCYVHVGDLRVFNTLQRVDLDSEYRGVVRSHYFNFFENWACRLWSVPSAAGGCVPAFPALAHRPETPEGPCRVHLVIAGFNRMGQALALQAARVAHYGGVRKTRITVLDPAMDALEPVFRSYCRTEGIPDVEFVFLPDRIESKNVREMLAAEAPDKGVSLTVAVCLSDPDAAMAAALSLPLAVLNADVPILVWNEKRSGLKSLANRIAGETGEDRHRWKDLHFFGNLDDCLPLDERGERMAEAAHHAYLERLRAKKWFTEKPANREWPQLQERYRFSTRRQVNACVERLRANGFALEKADAARPLLVFTPEETERLAEAEHERWLAERAMAGWTLGKRDDNALRHPDMVPYAQLSNDTRDFDRGAVSDAPGFLRAHYGIDIVRVTVPDGKEGM